ncbi:MAG TPA: dTDP-4-amino-4,6-dideoxygalactose transaminase [Longimicrobiales bacterium]
MSKTLLEQDSVAVRSGMEWIPFNRPYLTGAEAGNIQRALERLHFSGDGEFTRACHDWMRAQTGTRAALLTHSCTAALEMSAILAAIEPGDEVIMPSYTFVSTANAFVLRGGVPVFVDVRPDTFNIDEKLIEQAITSRTRAIVVVHYAGVGCEMDVILDIARRHGLLVIEDAAQGVMASYRGKALGAIGELGTFSFHETKNVIAGEAGALLVNDERFEERAEIIREKGTNRRQFFRGQVDKYTWVDIGSSYLPGEIMAAFLFAQLEQARSLTDRRLAVWREYHERLAGLEEAGRLRRPVVPEHCSHNAHMYYIVLDSIETRARVIEGLAQRGVHAVFHYVPLHDAPGGQRWGRAVGDLRVTQLAGACLLRLPLWIGVDTDRVVDALHELLG